MKHLLILGGGFAGVETAISLQKSGMFDITLVSDRDYLYIYPVSIWIPTHGINSEKVKLPLKEVQQKFGFKVIIEKVVSIQSTTNTVNLENQTLNYDYLVVAFGAEKLMPSGVENTLSICGKPQLALDIQEQLDKLIQQKHGKIAIGFGGNPKDKSAVRGGPAFEFAFNVHHYLKKKGLRDKFEINFFAPMASPGERMGKQALALMDKMMNKTHIQKYFGKKIKTFNPNAIVFEDDSTLEADLIMFIAASTGHSILKNSDLTLNEVGFAKIDDNCLVENTTNVYAVGDAAALTGYDWVAKQGHMAEVMGKNTAYNIIQQEKGNPSRKGYKKHLNIMCVMDTGNGAAFIYRDNKKAFVIPMPIVGHWLKQAWGIFTKLSKKGILPRM